jgi:hypothetical protein
MPLGLPDLQTNELVYSVIARYSDRVNYRNATGVLRDLFGNTTWLQARGDLPGRLSNVVAAYPHGSCYTLDYLIDKHTLCHSLPTFSRLNKYKGCVL